ncbi:MAG: hypothetical protein ACTTH7_10305 [Treponema sp.]
MIRIFKYTFLHRIPAMLRYNGILIGMACIEFLFLAAAEDPHTSFYALWLVATLGGLIGVPLYLMIRCSSGYARALLFTDESYLILTLPVKSEHILIGRMLAGLAELIISMIISAVFGIGLFTLSDFLQHKNTARYVILITDTLYMVFIRNYQLIIAGLCMLLIGFIFVGTSALFSQTAVRSFTVKRRKGVITLFSIVVFMFVIFFIGKVQEWANSIVNLQVQIDTYNWYYEDATLVELHIPFTLPIVSMFVALALSVGSFFSAAWLLRKRIEV